MRIPVPTVAAVHDMSGVGRCALTVAIPVISAMGSQVCPAPTAVLSAQTGFYGKYDIETMDLSEFLRRQLEAWKKMGLDFDCIYTGYLGSPSQAEVIAGFMDSQPRSFKLVDPVMGDDGALYPGISGDMVAAMAALCRRASLSTPNLTEYAALTGEEYSLRERSPMEIERMLSRLESESAVITSVPCGGTLVNACRDRAGNVDIIPFKVQKRHYPGTGDLFSSVVCGALMRGDDIRTAVELASEYISKTIEISMDLDIDSNFGVQLERTLPMLMKNAGEERP